MTSWQAGIELLRKDGSEKEEGVVRSSEAVCGVGGCGGTVPVLYVLYCRC